MARLLCEIAEPRGNLGLSEARFSGIGSESSHPKASYSVMDYTFSHTGTQCGIADSCWSYYS